MKFEFAEDVYVDDPRGQRVLAPKGATFVAELADEEVVDKTGLAPKLVKTGRKVVVASDVEVLPGCLTSCIRTGRAVEAGSAPPPKATAPQPAVPAMRKAKK